MIELCDCYGEQGQNFTGWAKHKRYMHNLRED